MSEKKAYPKAISLTFTAKWINPVSPYPYMLCIHFGPPPSAFFQSQYVNNIGIWQFTMNIKAIEKIPTFRDKDEVLIPKEKCGLLWSEKQPFGKYRYVVVLQHSRFPPNLQPHVIAFHVDKDETNGNTLALVPKKSLSLEFRKGDSHLRIIRGRKYNVNITFPD